MHHKIQKLPKHLINKLKAGEIVERPASVVKELIENSLDAGGTSFDIDIWWWGKKLIKIADNGHGMSPEDLRMSIQRYATSKISSAEDLEDIHSYGFRGEALSSISEVSMFRIQTKTVASVRPPTSSEGAIFLNDTSPLGGEVEGANERNTDPAYELYRNEDRFDIKEIPFAREHGTTVYVEDIFHAIPAREKFLKADATEWKYVKTLISSYAIAHRDKSWTLHKEWKVIYNLTPAWSLMQRVLEMTKQWREQNLKPVLYQDQQIELTGVVGDATLHFSSGQYFWIFVNGRPVHDRVLKKAVMQAFKRQIVPGSYPFVCLFIDIDPHLVDVNVHPRKTEVKFLDPGGVFRLIERVVQEAIWWQKVNYAAFRRPDPSTGSGWHFGDIKTTYTSYSTKRVDRIWWTWKEDVIQSGAKRNRRISWRNGWWLSDQQIDGLRGMQGELFGRDGENPYPNLATDWVPLSGNNDIWLEDWSSAYIYINLDWQQYRLIGQMWDMYIVLENQDSVIYIDQHALAERVAFERMRSEVAEKWYVSHVLLTPMTVQYPADVEDIDQICEVLWGIWFDVSEFGQQKVVIYAIPQVFADWKVDVELVMNWVWGIECPPTPCERATSDGEVMKNNGEQIFWLMLDEMLGMKACKASIKAGQRLSLLEMQQLIYDADIYIQWVFVCQHGRPSVVRMDKQSVDGLFDR